MTHRMITSKFLRQHYARELWQARIMRRVLDRERFDLLRWGIESGVWAVQKGMREAGIC